LVACALAWLGSGCEQGSVAPDSGAAAKTTLGIQIDTETAVVDAVAAAYERRDAERLAALLAPEYLFVGATPGAAEVWGRTEERRIHRRMFAPESVPPGDTPVPLDLWPLSIRVKLTQVTTFSERPEFYWGSGNPTGIDPTRWLVRGARYLALARVDTQGETDFVVEGVSEFIVMTSRTEAVGGTPHAMLLQWADLGAPAKAHAALELATWTQLKSLYR
jgi:hypothetical protein